MIKAIGKFLRLFRRSEDGGPSVEFVLVFTPFMILTVSAFELGLLMTRHVMIERGMDMAVREVRLNTNIAVDEDSLKVMICNAAAIIPDCTNRLKLEMVQVDPRAWADIEEEADCIDVANPFLPSRNFENGQANEIMVVRACAQLVPMLPETGLGYFLSRQDSGYYRLVSTTAFAMEPI